MLLMIDNYDSFTYNLVHYFQGLGQQVKTVRNDEITIEKIVELSPEFIVISPGPCDPDQAGVSLAVIQYFAGKTPILGVCLGHQCIAQYFGADVIKAKKVMHGKVSKISHNQQGLFQKLNNPLQVTRYHSLVVKHQSLPECLEVTAWSESSAGEKEEIMAIKHKNMALAGVQFHPESILTEQGFLLLKNFISQYSS